jgi:signal transduction histidine kinase
LLGKPGEDFNTFQSLVNNDKSTGLGLSIVVESYKGKIWIESVLGEGATFTSN